jgi:hypothetical protein
MHNNGCKIVLGYKFKFCFYPKAIFCFAFRVVVNYQFNFLNKSNLNVNQKQSLPKYQVVIKNWERFIFLYICQK